MTADAPGATQDYSTRPERTPSPREGVPRAPGARRAGRTAIALAGLAGVVLLVVSTWATVVEIRVLTTSDLTGVDSSISGGDLHGVALVLVAAFALVMLVGALRGARPAMVALAVSGLVAVGLIVGLDVPELHDTGQVAEFYEDPSAGASTGFYEESLGGVLLLAAGGGLLLLGGTRRAAPGDGS
jgi:hypothetical protein